MSTESESSDSIECRAGRECEGPGGGGQSVGRQDLLGARNVGQQSVAGRLEDRGENDFKAEQGIDQPDVGRPSHEQQPQDDEPARDIRQDHQPPPREPVRDVPGERGHQEPGKRLDDDGPAHCLPAPGQPEQQVIDRKAVKPVADLADKLRHPQAAEVGVGAKQRKIPEVQRHLPQGGRFRDWNDSAFTGHKARNRILARQRSGRFSRRGLRTSIRGRRRGCRRAGLSGNGGGCRE